MKAGSLAAVLTVLPLIIGLSNALHVGALKDSSFKLPPRISSLRPTVSNFDRPSLASLRGGIAESDARRLDPQRFLKYTGWWCLLNGAASVLITLVTGPKIMDTYTAAKDFVVFNQLIWGARSWGLLMGQAYIEVAESGNDKSKDRLCVMTAAVTGAFSLFWFVNSAKTSKTSPSVEVVVGICSLLTQMKK